MARLTSCSLIGLGLILALVQPWTAFAANYKDIYLTENRICHACQAEWVDKTHVRLTNRGGDRIVVTPGEVLGIDQHPVWRRIFLKSLSGVGLPGPVIVPHAFENGNDFVCKYCDLFGY